MNTDDLAPENTLITTNGFFFFLVGKDSFYFNKIDVCFCVVHYSTEAQDPGKTLLSSTGGFYLCVQGCHCAFNP